MQLTVTKEANNGSDLTTCVRAPHRYWRIHTAGSPTGCDTSVLERRDKPPSKIPIAYDTSLNIYSALKNWRYVEVSLIYCILSWTKKIVERNSKNEEGNSWGMRWYHLANTILMYTDPIWSGMFALILWAIFLLLIAVLCYYCRLHS